MNLRLGFVQPEVFNAVVVVIFLDLIPVELGGFGVGGVDEGYHAKEIEGGVLSVFGADKHIAVVHLPPVFALGADVRPYRHDRLYAHLFELIHHCFGVWPVLGVEFKVALFRPVEEVDDDCVYRYPAALVLPRDVQKDILRLIPALPEAGSPAGHHRSVAGEVGIGAHDIARRVPDEYQIVRLISAVRNPHDVVEGSLAPSGSGVVPQEAVAE